MAWPSPYHNYNPPSMYGPKPTKYLHGPTTKAHMKKTSLAYKYTTKHSK
ncbi:unnamed protein product [Linum tenue]|uniref:Uncharacterized protein n=1 Tax=Linum tenue TaxID=586396 RepID=A0AAV0IFE7_9ROSI|nr:unnamed protein product [Linum tenue]CAI0395728.1 unnamed protein product [Linum tenue]